MLLAIVAKASITRAQTYIGQADRFEVTSGANVVQGSSTTTVKFKFRVVRQALGTGGFSPFYMNFRVGIVQAPGAAVIEYLSDANANTPVLDPYTITSSNFANNNAFYEGAYEFNVNSTKLTHNYYLVIFYNIPNAGSTFYQQYSSYSAKISNPPPVVLNPIVINSINKVETILIGTDCGFQHAYGTSYNPTGHMENGVWKFVYDINYTKNNSGIADSDIYWEWDVLDYSNYPTTEKQFLVYPYAGTKYGPFNGEKKVNVEANDFLDEYESKVTVRAKSRSTGSVYSPDYTFYFTAVNH